MRDRGAAVTGPNWGEFTPHIWFIDRAEAHRNASSPSIDRGGGKA